MRFASRLLPSARASYLRLDLAGRAAQAVGAELQFLEEPRQLAELLLEPRSG
jgi:hypothetical protein